MMKIIFAATLMIFLVTVDRAYAGRPLNTDDAAILRQGACQFEASWKPPHYSDQTGHELAMRPACNVGGDIEWSLAYKRLVLNDGINQHSLGLGAKTLFKPVEAGTWGAGLSVGATADVTHRTRSQDVYGNLLYSIAPNDLLTFHLNAGALRSRDGGTVATWSSAFEYNLNTRSAVIAEMYGEQKQRPFWQVGGRSWIVQDRLQMDAVIGNQLGAPRDGLFATIGITLVWGNVFGR